MNNRLNRYQEYEDKATMIGWDFSFLSDKITEEKLPWDYKTIIGKYLNSTLVLLDMETGGGEFLLSLSHPNHRTTVTEGYSPNVLLCEERLSPLGIKVVEVDGDEPLPFKDDSFDIIINRHGAYLADEIKRVLKQDGVFITQQVGSFNNKPMSDFLTPWRTFDYQSHTLQSECDLFTSKGFEILEFEEKKGYVRYHTIEAVIFMAKIIEWEFPDFSAEKCIKELQIIEQIIEQKGYFESIEHRFYIVATNKK